MLEADYLASLFAEPSPGRRVPLDPYGQLRYLVIDDQDAARQTLKMCIQSMGGFSVDQASSSNEAANRIGRNMPDVILCDYMLGNGQTGQQLLEDLRRSHRLPDTVAFLMVTAERSYEQVVSAVELTPDDYIIKPFSPDILRGRMDRVIRKKIFFNKFLEHRQRGQLDAALAELTSLEGAEEGRQYRFDIMRARAETLLMAERYHEALDCFAPILAIHPFPWAQAGQARALRHLNRHEEAAAAVDCVIEASPNYFEAYDLKADICCDRGEFDQAQAILQRAAERTPRNWGRKRNLSVVAKQNGDFVTAKRLMEEVIANNAAGGFPVRDRIELVRTALASGDRDQALVLIGELAAPEREALAADVRLDIECLEAQLEGAEAGEKRFERIRTELGRVELPVDAALDAVAAALLFSDRELADRLAEKLLTGHDAQRAFHALLDIYRSRELEEHFRQLQRNIASRRLAGP
ncbi:MAG: response regulator [Gammaproteobacteria bacterium]|nr:response regulator [Gammaproteobacteria bacterium]MBU1646124.1 response regulator [Gammaproteobacteria bacterium]MBU1972186.1 response regulator [Gammaproteobacteria bacterium]